MNSQLAFVLVLGLAAMCSAHIGGLAPSEERIEELFQSYCGRTLARALALVCANVPPTNKRSDVGMYDAILSSPYKEQDMHMDGPWIVPYKARGMSSQRNKRQYIVNECCEKPCRISELQTYC